MKFRTALLAASCTLALAACGTDDRPVDTDPADTTVMPADPAGPASSDPVETTPTGPAPDAETVPAPEDIAADVGNDDVSETADLAGERPPNSEHPTAGAENVGDATTDCGIAIEGNDRMQFNLDSINVPASCSEFTITLEHTGSLPVAAMGHNVVVTTTEDYPAAAAEGLTAGAAAGYVQPDDDRVIAATDMIGGGETTAVTFSTSSLDQGTDYTFFCSFPGHSALMRGTLTFGG